MTMKHLDEYRNADLVRALAKRLGDFDDRPIRIMEVCGTHTMAIFRYGIRELIPKAITLVSGPGCPVCVTPPCYIDEAAKLARLKNVILGTFGDLLRVPGNHTSLLQEKSMGADIRVLYSPLDAVPIAAENPDKMVVFLGIGFETTAPIVALSIQQAMAEGLSNFCVFSAHKRVAPAMEALASNQGLQIDGFLCPGHVCTVTGLEPYRFLSDQYALPAVVAGFEIVDILHGLNLLAEMIRLGRPDVVNAYPRAVAGGGNVQAQEILNRFFTAADSSWRGLGLIPRSGLTLRPEYANFDAARKFGLEEMDQTVPNGCICGEILTGRKAPPDCGLYKTSCTPHNPQGACMVSSEGTCAAYYRYHIG